MSRTSLLAKLGLGTVVVAASALATHPASAVSGVVTGTLAIKNKNGGFCPSSRDCTGASYVQTCPAGASCTGGGWEQSQYDTYSRVRNVVVYVYSTGAGTTGLVGQGRADDAGNFSVSWSYSGSLPNPAKSYIIWRPYDADGKFLILTQDGGGLRYGGPYFTLSSGTQSLGSFNYAADPWGNTYWAAALEWRTSLIYSGVLWNNLNNVHIRGFSNDAMPAFSLACPSSCAMAPLCNCPVTPCDPMKIALDANAGYSPQARVMHELGHIASQSAKQWRCPTGLADWDGIAGWGMETFEWKVSGFEDARASFAGDSAFYWPNAVAPYTCWAAQGTACITTYNIETSHYPNCVANEDRMPISSLRMLWDVYDDAADAFDWTARGWDYWWQVWDLPANYPDGTGTNQNDEIWNSNYTAVTEPDGHSAASFEANYSSTYGATLPYVRSNNCSP